jgi:hypothetical protein
MSESGSWDVISGADSGPVVLGVDFPAAGREEAGFPALAAMIGPGRRFLQTRPPTAESCRKLPGDAYVGPWVDGIRQAGHQVLGVLGYGIGSVYAAAIAEAIARWQEMPRIILFDPQLSTVELLCREFSREIRGIRSLLSNHELERASKAVAKFSRATPPDVALAAAEMIESYLEVIAEPFERVGLGDARSNNFTVLFVSYMAWLSAADRIDPSSAWKRSTVIASSAYAGLAVRPPDDGRDLIGRVIPFDVTRADLLRSESVAQAVLGLLES